MTGRDLARKIVGRHNVHLSAHSDRYDPLCQRVYLTIGTMMGTNCEALMTAAHECVHRLQHVRGERMGPRWFTPLRVWREWRAWIEAYRLARPYLPEPDQGDARAMKWRAFSYL